MRMSLVSTIPLFVRANDFQNLNLQLVLEDSPDMVDWNPVDLSGASVNAIDSNRESVTLNVSLSPSSPRIFRLRAIRPAN